MKIIINKKESEIAKDTTLAELIRDNNMTMTGIAVAINGKVVRRGEWETTLLSDGMEITVISAVCGG